MEEIKFLCLKFERAISNINCLETDKSANFDVKDVAKDFSAYFLNLAANHLSTLPNPSNKYGVLSVAQYYCRLGPAENLIYYKQRKNIIKLLRDIDT